VTSFRERHITLQDGLKLYFRDYGDTLSPRAPLLCLSGLVRNSTDFADVAERHAGERRVIAPDYRGRGRSDYDTDWRHYDPFVYVNDLAHLIAATGLERIIVLGTSLGAALAMGLAVMKPTAIAAVVLNDLGPDVAPDGLGRILAYVGRDHPQPDWPSAVRYLQQLLPHLSIRTEEGWMKLARGTFREAADGLLHVDWDITLARRLGQVSGAVPNLWPYYRALGRVPTLALRGELSDVLSSETFERMALAKPDLERVTVRHAGHTPTLSEPDAASALDDFIRRF
jgi:pimeloyl-ACP methyl ester carboxylesterase